MRSDVDDCRLVHTIPRGAAREIRAQLTILSGRVYADLRLFVVSQETGNLIPTRKGVTIPVAELPELRKAVEALIETTQAMDAKSAEPAVGVADAEG